MWVTHCDHVLVFMVSYVIKWLYTPLFLVCRELSCIMWNQEIGTVHFCFFCMDFQTVGLVGGTRFRC